MVRLPDNSDSDEGVFRSAPMTLVQFYVTLELARDIIYVLGNSGSVHFRDLNSKLTPFQRTFVSDLRKIDLYEQKLTFLHQSMENYNTMKVDPYLTFYQSAQAFPSILEIDEIKTRINETYDKIHQLHVSYNSLDSQIVQLVENRFVMNAVNDFHSSLRTKLDPFAQIVENSNDEEGVGLLNLRNNSLELGDNADAETIDRRSIELDLDDSSFNSISGTIISEKIPLLRKILWRTLRGNLYFHDIRIDDNDSEIEKSIFIIFIHGDFLKLRVRKIIQSLDGYIYENVNGSSQVRNESLIQLNHQIQDLGNVVEATKSHLISELMVFQDSFPHYYYRIKREKLIYETLNKFDMDGTRRCLVGEGWIPQLELKNIRRDVKQLIRQRTNADSAIDDAESEHIIGSNNSANVFQLDDSLADDADAEVDSSLIAVVNELSTNRTPPTFHKTNKFTAAFQLIIDAYGIATYQEVNPGLATIITFPFMFAIMFGDVGHGFIVTCIALYFIVNEYKFNMMRNKDEIFEMAFGGRYIILLMGIFSMYTGFIYNDIFSKSMAIFPSGWEWKFPEDYKPGMTVFAEKLPGKTHFFGLDWAWHGAENNLLFTNSYKMKLSVIMGFIHMNYSFVFSLVNFRFFNSTVDIIGNFIPGLLFMQSIFGYLTLCIIYKWTVDWYAIDKQPPGLLNMLINMFLAPGKIEAQLYPGQKYLQIVLVLIALCCVPWLLVYKPWYLKKQNDRAVGMGYSDIHSQINHEVQRYEEDQALNGAPIEDEIDMLGDDFRFPNDIEPMNMVSSGHGDHEEFNFGDIVIHQVIHTIEFCLNCVSHTASYLRLWALSLAHAQLSTVLWGMTIQNSFGTTGATGIITTVFLFGLWFVLSVCILVLMEGTSAMLHSLRLHWVEAMSKFFMGEGYAYQPFTFDIEI